MNKKWTYNDYTIVGLLDSDGTHTIRVLRRKTPSLGFTVLSSFSQTTSNFDAIETIIQSYEEAKGYNFAQHTVLKKDDSERQSSRLDINWNTSSGEKFLEMLQNKQSLSPGKLRDFKIAEKVNAFSKDRQLLELDPTKFIESNGTYTLESVSLTGETVKITLEERKLAEKTLKKENIKQIAIAYLARQTTEKYKEEQSYPAKLALRFKEIELDCEHIQATPEEKALGYKLGKYFTFKIEQFYKDACNSIRNKSSIPNDSIVGMHIGDGTLGCERILPDPDARLRSGKRLRYEVRPFMRVNQSNDSIDLLQAYKNSFQAGTLEKRTGDTRYKLVGAKACSEKLIPILKSCSLPQTKQHQLNLFEEICTKGIACEHLTWDGFLRIVDWKEQLSLLTPGSPLEKQNWIEKGKKYFRIQN